jgi:hypothetical protein
MKQIFHLTFTLLSFLLFQTALTSNSTTFPRNHSIYHHKRTNSDINYINNNFDIFYLGTENYYIEFNTSLFTNTGDSTFTLLSNDNTTSNVLITSVPNNEHTFKFNNTLYTIDLNTLGIDKDNETIKFAFKATTYSITDESKWFLFVIAPNTSSNTSNTSSYPFIDEDKHFEYKLWKSNSLITLKSFSTFITQQFLYEFSTTISICLICAGVIIGISGSYHTLFTFGMFFCCFIYIIAEEALVLSNNPIQEIQFGTLLVAASLILGFALGAFTSTKLIQFHPALYGSAITFIVIELFIIFFDVYNPIAYAIVTPLLMIIVFIAVKFLLYKQFLLRQLMVLSSCFVGSYLIISGVSYTVGGLCNFKVFGLNGMKEYNSNGAKGKLLYGVLLLVLLVVLFIGQNMYLENVESEVCPVKQPSKDLEGKTVLISLNKHNVFGEEPSVRLSHGPNNDVSEVILHNDNKTFELGGSNINEEDKEDDNQNDDDIDERGIEEEEDGDDGNNEYDS